MFAMIKKNSLTMTSSKINYNIIYKTFDIYRKVYHKLLFCRIINSYFTVEFITVSVYLNKFRLLIPTRPFLSYTYRYSVV